MIYRGRKKLAEILVMSLKPPHMYSEGKISQILG
jgi:hypothetical protein